MPAQTTGASLERRLDEIGLGLYPWENCGNRFVLIDTDGRFLFGGYIESIAIDLDVGGVVVITPRGGGWIIKAYINEDANSEVGRKYPWIFCRVSHPVISHTKMVIIHEEVGR